MGPRTHRAGLLVVLLWPPRAPEAALRHTVQHPASHSRSMRARAELLSGAQTSHVGRENLGHRLDSRGVSCIALAQSSEGFEAGMCPSVPLWLGARWGCARQPHCAARAAQVSSRTSGPKCASASRGGSLRLNRCTSAHCYTSPSSGRSSTCVAGASQRLGLVSPCSALHPWRH